MNQNKKILVRNSVGAIAQIALLWVMGAPQAHALELDWSGDFRSEFHLIKNYTMDSSTSTPDSTRIYPSKPNTATGYYVAPGGSSNATFETLYLKLNPKAVINDNIVVKSEFLAGNPTTSAFGDSYPTTSDQNQFYSNQSRGSVFSAQRLWAELTTDFGVLTIGRAPLNWGLGVVWSAGDGLWDRYESTADQVRLTSKFGSFTFSPGIAVYSSGNIFGGTCTFNSTTGNCVAGAGSGGVNDYFVQLKYENLEEEFEGGVNFVRRVVGGSTDPLVGAQNPTVASAADTQGAAAGASPVTGSVGMAFNTWDIYAQKKLGKFRLAAEVPITNGQVDGINYSTVAVATEEDWRINDSWELQSRIGLAPGQPNEGSPSVGDSFKAYFFNPNYHIGTILFNYQLANLGGINGPNTLNNPNVNASNQASPFDNPITNAKYMSLGGVLHADKWTFNTAVIHAIAAQTAVSGQYFFNTWKRQMEYDASGNQGSSLGWEWDAGAAFQWDESFTFRWDLGIYFPGSYYAFSNSATGPGNATSTVLGSVFRVGIKF